MVFGDGGAEFCSLGMLMLSSSLWGCWCSSGLWDVGAEFCSLRMLMQSSGLWGC